MLADALMYARALYRPSHYYLFQVLARRNSALHESADTSELIFKGGKIKALPFFFRPSHLEAALGIPYFTKQRKSFRAIFTVSIMICIRSASAILPMPG